MQLLRMRRHYCHI